MHEFMHFIAINFYPPVSIDRGHIVLPFCVCLSVFLSVGLQTYFICEMATDVGFFLTVVNDREAEGAEQDQTARMCRLILLYTSSKINLLSQTSGWEQAIQNSISDLHHIPYKSFDSHKYN